MFLVFFQPQLALKDRWSLFLQAQTNCQKWVKIFKREKQYFLSAFARITPSCCFSKQFSSDAPKPPPALSRSPDRSLASLQVAALIVALLQRCRCAGEMLRTHTAARSLSLCIVNVLVRARALSATLASSRFACLLLYLATRSHDLRCDRSCACMRVALTHTRAACAALALSLSLDLFGHSLALSLRCHWHAQQRRQQQQVSQAIMYLVYL